MLSLILSVSCEKENGNGPQFSGRLISNSDCKYQKSAPVSAETADTLSCIEYSFDTITHTLSLTHVNAGFNCCPGEINCTFNLKGDTIVIEEYENTDDCDCECLYDLHMEIKNTELRKYQVKVNEQYIKGQEKLEFEIDLANDTTGSICVARKKYPWGVTTLF